MSGIREKIGNRILKKRSRSFQRETRVYNFESAKTAVVLFDAQKKDALKIIWEFRGFLKDHEIDCKIFGYINQKEVPPDMLFWKDLYMINKSNLNWYLRPKGEAAELFRQEDPDILINFHTSYLLEIQFLVQLSTARFKIGCFTEEKNDYDLMINLSEKNDMAYFSEQIKHYVSILNPSK
ncbi:MAG: hypothetical protein P1P86_04165 [Bacteroidales bacterium]|nr:hypothetical protein [Bacteroidales bacterium]